MSLMTDILGAVSRNPGSTVSELADTLETAEKRVRDNLIHARNRLLVTMRKDDVTNLPGYTLTAAGNEFLAKSSDSGGSSEAPVTTPKPPEYNPDSVSFDAKKRAAANQRRAEDAEKDAMALMGIIADIRKAIGDPEGKIMLGDLAEQIQRAYQLGDAHRAACVEWERSMLEATGHDSAPSAISAIRVIESALAIERQARQALQEQIDAAPGVDVTVAATGYVMVASKRKPRRITKPETAREAALSAIRTGAQRAEVFALVPVGKAVRGAQWRDA